jgi:sulfonate transport system substrate-binding protein
MKKLVIAVALAAMVSAFALYRLNRSPEVGQGLPVVRLGSFSVAVDYAPYLIAKNKGWFKEVLGSKGYAIEFTTFQSLPPINEALATGQVDALVAAEPPFIVGNAAGIKSEIVAISCSLVQEILVPADSGIETPAGLKGKKIAVLAGTSSHYGLFKLLEHAGVDKSEVSVVDMIPPDAKVAFETNQVDAWAVWPPFVEQEEISGKGKVLPKGDAVIHSVMGVRGAFLEEHPEVVRELVATLERAKQWIRENESEAIRIVSAEIDVPVEVVERAWPRHDWDAVLSDNVKIDIQAKADFLYREGFVKQQVNAARIIDVTFTSEEIEPVVPAAGDTVPAAK